MIASAVAIGLALGVGKLQPFLFLSRDVDLRAEVIEAIENGPVVVDVSLTNRGNGPIPYHWWISKASRLHLPTSWGAKPRTNAVFSFGVSDGRTDLDPGKAKTERHNLHVDLDARFPVGKYRIPVSWTIYLYPPGSIDRDETIPVVLTRTLELSITPATRTTLSGLASQLDAEMRTVPYRVTTVRSEEDLYRDIAYKLVHTRHRELIPTACRLFDRMRYVPRYQLLETIFAPDPMLAHRLFVDRLTSASPPDDPQAYFSEWLSANRYFHDFGSHWHLYFLRYRAEGRVTRTPLSLPGSVVEAGRLVASDTYGAGIRVLPDRELRRLATANDYWVRAWTFAAFYDRLEPEWKARFEADTRNLVGRPMPTDQARELIRKLDDPRYQVRERAYRDLYARRHSVEPEVVAALASDPTPETRARLKQILDSVRQTPVTPRDEKALAGFSPGYAPHQRVLDLLAAGPEGHPLSRMVRKKVAEYEEEQRKKQVALPPPQSSARP